MHSYLRAIGFSKYNNTEEINEILKYVMEQKEQQDIAEYDNGFVLAEIRKSFGMDFGICICGEYNKKNVFEKSYYYPYFNGGRLTTEDHPTVEKHAEKESYAGVCDDYKVGVSLIFYLQNVAEYKNELRLGRHRNHLKGVTLSGLSIQGCILLPINKNDKQKKDTQEAVQYRNKLIAAARQGDEDAIESLTLEDIDTYTMVSRRVMQEDVLSIVESYFMPYGVECDQYSVLGEILDYRLEKNQYTDESIYVLTINCNEMIFDVCINTIDLLGEPEIGRRFKGDIWIQGKIRYES